MAALEMYLKAVRNSRGLEHSERLRALRDYLKHTPDADLIRQINYMTDEKWLDTLWEAGLNKWLQDAVLRRRRELRARRAER